MQRREFLKVWVAGAVAFLSGWLTRAVAGETAVFRHGVASGDPTSDRLVIWTRVSGQQGEVAVRWVVAEDPEMKQVLRKGKASTSGDRDFTVKVDVDGLPQGQQLYYQFLAQGEHSPVGRARTLPQGSLDAATLAVVSCSNYPSGYFHVYRDIAEQEGIDAVLHLGDYIYEYGPGGYATEFAEALGRVPEPPAEIVSIDDYRTRYAQYRSDPDCQAMHASAAFIPVWDDHEFTNDAWRDGAQNHQDDEGEWTTRRDEAIKAWLEWMPVRADNKGPDTRTYRSFRYGDLLDLIMLDTRLIGRDKQPDAGNPSREDIVAALQDPSRELLGTEQSGWLANEVNDECRWQALGQQIMMMPNLSPDIEESLDLEKPAMVSQEYLERIIAGSKGNPPMLLDTWNGYPFAREKVLGLLAQKASNPVIISGDLHTAMAGSVYSTQAEKTVAVELMTPAVSSPGFTEYLPERYPGALADAMKETNPNVDYIDTVHKGWMKVSFTPELCTTEWRLVSDVRKPEYTVRIGNRLSVAAGRVSDGLFETPES